MIKCRSSRSLVFGISKSKYKCKILQYTNELMSCTNPLSPRIIILSSTFLRLTDMFVVLHIQQTYITDITNTGKLYSCVGLLQHLCRADLHYRSPQWVRDGSNCKLSIGTLIFDRKKFSIQKLFFPGTHWDLDALGLGCAAISLRRIGRAGGRVKRVETAISCHLLG